MTFPRSRAASLSVLFCFVLGASQFAACSGADAVGLNGNPNDASADDDPGNGDEICDKISGSGCTGSRTCVRVVGWSTYGACQ